MKNQLQIFDNKEFGQVRMVEVNGKPYAVGIDIARVLEYANPSKAVIQHCKNIEKQMLETPSQSGNVVRTETNLIPEGDIYRLIVKAADQSKNPQIKAKAEKFEKWIFDEVIPELRRTGSYMMPNSLQALKLINQQVGALIGTVEDIGERVESLENNMTVDFGQQRRLQNKAKSKAVSTLGGLDSPAYKNNSVRSKVFSAIWRDYKDYFMVGSYRDTSRIDFEKGMEYLDKWQVQGKLLREIEECNKQMNIREVI